MRRLEVFFDYACPYCMRAHGILKDLISRFPGVKIVWRPCESHPRPDRYGPHSDLCIRGMFFAAEKGADLWDYHERMYKAALVDRRNIEDPAVLSQSVRGLLDERTFLGSLQNGEYAAELRRTNAYADRSGVWVVPAYRMEGKKLDAIEDVGIFKEQLDAFLKRMCV